MLRVRGGGTDFDESDGTDDHDSIENRLDALVEVRTLFCGPSSSGPFSNTRRRKSTH